MAANGQALAQQIAGQAPPTIQELDNMIRAQAQRLGQQPAPIYGAPRVAPLPPAIQRAQQLAGQVGAAEPLLQEARRLPVRTFPQAHQEYMNPYVQEVVRRAAEEGNENLARNILPALDAKFSGLGQFGSTRHQKAAAQAARDIQRDISANQQKALLTGYHHAGELFNRDQMANLERGNMLARLGAVSQSGREADIGGLAKMGDYERQYEQQMRDVQYQNWLRQHSYDWDVLSKWIAANQNIPYPTTNTNVEVAPQQPILNAAGSAGVIAGNLLPALLQQQQVGGGRGGMSREQALNHMRNIW
jgi:hypothetical protein